MTASYPRMWIRKEIVQASIMEALAHAALDKWREAEDRFSRLTNEELPHPFELDVARYRAEMLL